ncbi:hypothetical protein AOQ84DRAFT_313094 [Glonium stellatum]|uniref:Uncharacterized protein n=1 Tax=Glonium stellatum TaxID=574774 RepID=A0A8E2F7S9_9PEZI|nr:hypothetical protein AOQ84DRAFT_313094 [Glonium stellatum]
MASPGLLFVSTRISFPELTDEVYNKWYDSIHVVDVLKSGLADLALRFKNVDPEAKKTYLAVYRVPDVSRLQDQAIKDQIPPTSDMLPGSGDFNDLVELDIKAFVPIQAFEGQGMKKGRGKGLLTVLMEPAEGGDDELDEWYRKQHHDMVSMCKGYRRSTRYRVIDNSKPRYLTIHEFDTTDMPWDQLKMTSQTEWGKKVIGSMQSMESNVWELIIEKDKTMEKL